MAIADNMPNDRPGDMARRIADLERAVRELRAARNLDQGSITPEPGMGIRTGDFDGTDFAHPGTTGNYFGGDGLVANSLYLRPGSISNDELTNPTAPAAVFDYVQNFALSTTLTNIKTTTVTVPAGFTKASVSIVVRVFAINPNTTGGYDGAGGDYLYGQANINGSNGFALPLAVSGSGGSGTNNSPFSKVLTGLTPGDSISLQIAASTAFANWAANSANVAEVSGSINWYR